MLIALSASRGVKRSSLTGEIVSISRRTIPRQVDCSLSIPDQLAKSSATERVEMKSELFPFKGKRPQPPW
jgi:hypothetical protein